MKKVLLTLASIAIVGTSFIARSELSSSDFEYVRNYISRTNAAVNLQNVIPVLEKYYPNASPKQQVKITKKFYDIYLGDKSKVVKNHSFKDYWEDLKFYSYKKYPHQTVGEVAKALMTELGMKKPAPTKLKVTKKKPVVKKTAPKKKAAKQKPKDPMIYGGLLTTPQPYRTRLQWAELYMKLVPGQTGAESLDNAMSGLNGVFPYRISTNPTEKEKIIRLFRKTYIDNHSVADQPYNDTTYRTVGQKAQHYLDWELKPKFPM